MKIKTLSSQKFFRMYVSFLVAETQYANTHNLKDDRIKFLLVSIQDQLIQSRDIIIKRCGEQSCLVHGSWEREERRLQSRRDKGPNIEPKAIPL